MTTIVDAVTRIEGRLRQCLAVALGVGSIGWGLSIILMPTAMSRLDVFRVTVAWAAPQTWGALLIVLGAVLIAAAYSSIRMAVWPAASLAVTYAMVSISVMLAARGSDPVPTAIWAYLTLGAVSGLLAWSSALEPRR